MEFEDILFTDNAKNITDCTYRKLYYSYRTLSFIYTNH